MQGAQIQSLFGELRSRMLHGAAKNKTHKHTHTQNTLGNSIHVIL